MHFPGHPPRRIVSRRHQHRHRHQKSTGTAGLEGRQPPRASINHLFSLALPSDVKSMRGVVNDMSRWCLMSTRCLRVQGVRKRQYY